MAGTEVYATIDGIMKHRHEGAKGWHSAHIKHADAEAHRRANATRPKFRAGTSDELKARYKEALAGKSFEYLWQNVSRREARLAGQAAPAVSAVENLLEEQRLLGVLPTE